ncbi:MAG: HAMP domain-containing histidine kinase [Anaerolineae bacterium]|nr:HAMP domain-containing histidine kinase [Anaerolineae bacterium]
MDSTEFKRILAHKLNNLLMMALNPAQMLDDPSMPPEQCAQLRAMLSDSLARMQVIFKDLTDLARAEDMDAEPRLAFRPGELVQQVVDQEQALALRQGVMLAFQADGAPDRDLTGQLELLERGLTYVIQNAIYYTPDGGRVTVGLAEKDGFVVIRVADGGFGLPPEDLGHAWEPFYHPKDKRTVQIPNMGLGLTLARAVIESHGGRVEIKSVPDQGSVYKLFLPLNQS